MKDILFISSISVCPSDSEWTYRQPYCYWNSEPTDEGRKGWAEAEDYCHEKGGHLASVHDDDEQRFVNNMVSRVAFIIVLPIRVHWITRRIVSESDNCQLF